MDTAAPAVAPLLLLTPRLRLVAPDESLAGALADFQDRNRAHLAPWEPPAPADFFSVEAQARRLRAAADDFAAGTDFRYLLQPIGDVGKVIGTVNFTTIVRGAFHSCNLGYALDQAVEGQALMSEALRAAIAEMFGAPINLHRIQAAYRPENWRSAEVLKRLGFEDVGVAPDYLFIEGMWRVHRIVALINKHFVMPEHWQTAQ